jgi:hypothetical protein
MCEHGIALTDECLACAYLAELMAYRHRRQVATISSPA